IGRWLHDGFGLDRNAVTIANPIGMGFVQGLLLVPLAFVLVGPPLRSVSGELIEAAEIYGVGVWRRAWRIELPLVTPALIAAAIFCFMVAVASFDVPAFIGMTYRQYTFSTYVYQLLSPQAGLPQYGPSAALSLIAMLAAFVLTAIYLRAIRRGRLYQVVTGKGYRVSPLQLKRSRGWIYAGLGLYFLLTFALPMLLVLWVALSRYFRPPSLEAFRALSFANFSSAPWMLAWRGFENTAILMIAVPLAAVALGLIISWVVVRSKSRLRGAI